MYLFRFCCCLILLIASNSVSAQETKPSYFSVGVEQTRFNYKFGTGLNVFVNVPVTDRLSVTYSAGVGIADAYGNYIRVPIGVAAAGYVLTLDNIPTDGNIIYLMIALALIPEGVSYTLVSNNRVDLNVYVNPLSLYFWRSDIEKTNPMIPQMGVSYLIKNSNQRPILRVHGSAMYQFSNQAVGVQFGVGFCISS